MASSVSALRQVALPEHVCNTSNMTQTGTTTRPVTFRVLDANRVATAIRTFPVGTEVYVSRLRADGTCIARVCGSLFEQRVGVDSVEPAA